MRGNLILETRDSTIGRLAKVTAHLYGNALVRFYPPHPPSLAKLEEQIRKITAPTTKRALIQGNLLKHEVRGCVPVNLPLTLYD